MICIWKRQKISTAIDAGESLPDDLRAHLESCASCRAFYEGQRTLDRALQHPVADKEPYPAGLNTAIMRAIRSPDEEVQVPAVRRRQFSPWLTPLAFASVALLAAVYLLVREPKLDEPVLANVEPAPIEDVVVQETPPSDYIRSWSIAINQPLDNELESVVADARSAVQFLAFNFLPEETKTTGQL